MSRPILRILLALGGIGLLASVPAAQEAPPAPVPTEKGVTVLAQGPVHEAYAQPVTEQPVPGPVVDREPPAPVEELPPDEKPEGDNVQWMPGYWHYDQERVEYVWVSGFWRVPPPGRQWVPGSWQHVEKGWQWVPGFWASGQQEGLTYLPPPPESLEVGPTVPAPTEESFYVPGTWVYGESRYRWRPGFYTAYREGWIWQPAWYAWTPAGCVFVDGYWDYPLERRGLLFPPVLFGAGVLTPGYTYTPGFAIGLDFLWGSLFVRPGWCHYYFGDYYSAGYTRLGFTPWIDYRYGRVLPDPLFGYYRLARRGTSWMGDLRGVYHGRALGTLPVPPRTLARQLALPGRGPGGPGGLAPVRGLHPLGQIGRHTPLNLTRIGQPARMSLQRQALGMRQIGMARRGGERSLMGSSPGPLRAGMAPRQLNLSLPGRSSGIGRSLSTSPRIGGSGPGSTRALPSLGGSPRPGGSAPGIGGISRPGGTPQIINRPGGSPGTTAPRVITRPGGSTPGRVPQIITRPGGSVPGIGSSVPSIRSSTPSIRPSVPSFQSPSPSIRSSVPRITRPSVPSLGSSVPGIGSIPRSSISRPSTSFRPSMPSISTPRPSAPRFSAPSRPSFAPRSAPSFSPRSTPSFGGRGGAPMRGPGGGRGIPRRR